MKKRGVDLPPWDDELGLKTNLFWTEVVKRDQRLKALEYNHEIMKAYAMSGVGPTVEWKDRYSFIEPLFTKLLAQIDHSAYRTTHKRGTLLETIRRLEERKKMQDRLDWITSDDFDLQAWVKGVDNGG